MFSKFLDENDWKPLLVSIGGSFLVYHGVRKLKQHFENCRDEWVPVGRVGKLNVYPIKSARGNSVFSIYCGTLGGRNGEIFDRHFMVINPNTNHFYTARQITEIFKIRCNIRDGIVSLKCDDNTIEFTVESVKQLDKHHHVTMFDEHTVECLNCGEEVEEWLHTALGNNEVALVMFHDKLQTNRDCITEGFWLDRKNERKDKTGFADMAPFLIANQASLDDLNTRLEKKLTLRSFRPNIEIDFAEAWAEDKWAKLKIGDAKLQVLQPCTRCIMTTIDPDSLDRNGEMQPLNTLKTFRSPAGQAKESVGIAPAFGMNAAVIDQGYCCVGDIVYATMRKDYVIEFA